MAKEVTKRAENYSQWYNDLALKADLAEQSAVRGCMVIKPYGYAIWEKMQSLLDGMFISRCLFRSLSSVVRLSMWPVSRRNARS